MRRYAGREAMTKNSGKKVSKESEIFQRKNLPIADQWTDSIFRFSLLLVVLIGLLELIISTLAGWSGSFGVGRDGFLVRYFFIPTGVNVILYLGAQGGQRQVLNGYRGGKRSRRH